MTTTTATYSASEFGTDWDRHYRGITYQDGIYTAFAKTFSRDFKTLAGAVTFMARMGYDAHGNRA